MQILELMRFSSGFGTLVACCVLVEHLIRSLEKRDANILAFSAQCYSVQTEYEHWVLGLKNKLPVTAWDIPSLPAGTKMDPGTINKKLQSTKE